MPTKCRNFMNSLLTDLILPELQVGQNFYLEIHVQISHISINL